jgi:hypothetical protein
VRFPSPEIRNIKGEKTHKMSTVKKPTMSITDAAKMLGTAMDRDPAEIEAKLETYVNSGLTLHGAVAKFKSDSGNKFALGAGRKEIIARFLGMEPARDVTLNNEPEKVSNMHFAVQDPVTKEITFVGSTVWTAARIAEMTEQFEKGVAYKFQAATSQKDGQEIMNRITKIEVLSDQKAIPKIEDFEPLPIESVSKAIGRNELIRGSVGKIIVSKGIVAGFEVSDMSPAPPFTVWFGGQYPKMSASEVQALADSLVSGDEVVVFGAIKTSASDINMNAINVTRIL